MFAPEGYRLIGLSLVIGALLMIPALMFSGLAAWPFKVAAVLVPAFTLYFFRDPRRVPPPEAGAGDLLLSPADGKVVWVGEVDEPLFIRGPAVQVSIFLSPLNVHVNRIPADGVIEYAEYVPGEYLVAWHEKASEKNERSILGLRHPGGTPVLFKQIAGMVARRIVYHVSPGDAVRAGDRFGIVKFGSRMDVLVPPDVAIRVQVGDRVRGGLTVLGRLTSGGDGRALDVPAASRSTIPSG